MEQCSEVFAVCSSRHHQLFK